MAQSKAFYAFGRAVCMPIFKLLYRYKVVNKSNIPDDGKGYIVACNHLSFSDPVLLGLGQKRRLNFMAKDELFENKFFAFIIRHLGAFPVKRGAGDGKAIKNGEDIILEGGLMGIFIEGGRSKTGELMRPRSGCALIAQQTGVSVVPACITNVGKSKKFGKRIIHFSEPLTTEDMGLTSTDRRALKTASTTIMNKIKEMREQDLNEYKRS
ncbi:MAG: lysophospholipid acyltransferase family protein [Ruminococcus sp.]|nr:lysophospholipid acyltransferase family protein [Ruminococcus sp.]